MDKKDKVKAVDSVCVEIVKPKKQKPKPEKPKDKPN